METAVKAFAVSGALSMAFFGALLLQVAQPAGMDCAALQAEPARTRVAAKRFADKRLARAAGPAAHSVAPPRRSTRRTAGDLPRPPELGCGPWVFGSLPPKCFRDGKYIVADGQEERKEYEVRTYDPDREKAERGTTPDEKWGPLL